MKARTGPDGIQFFSRLSGLNILIDEASVPATRWSQAPRQISVALTNACDLHCSYCYAPKHAARIDPVLLCAWLEELDANGCLGIGFGGGEPTLHHDFPWLCRFAAVSTELAVTFTTHAHRLRERLAADLKGYVHFIRVSMDGVGPTYEFLRGRTFQDFRRRLETIRNVAPFGINFVVNARTFPDIDAAVAIAIESGAVEFLLLPERPVRGGSGIDDLTRGALRSWVKSFRENIRLSVSEADAADLPACDPLPKEKGLRAYVHIDASGVLKRSSFDASGVSIDQNGVMQALRTLKQVNGGME
jgi:MoaA/NifB/PqqE/SkfB family radical SAM enzyme